MSFGQVTPTARRLIKERGGICEVEGCYNNAVEAHHCLYKRRRGKHPVPELDMDENLQLVCYEDHHVTGKADSYENRVQFWEKQCERFGREHMIAWHESLPIKVKENAYK
jgi:hypothetical protein